MYELILWRFEFRIAHLSILVYLKSGDLRGLYIVSAQGGLPFNAEDRTPISPGDRKENIVASK